MTGSLRYILMHADSEPQTAPHVVTAMPTSNEGDEFLRRQEHPVLPDPVHRAEIAGDADHQ
jgi:hypothetical protein